MWRRKRVPRPRPSCAPSFERREGVVGDLGLGGRHDREQRRFPGIGETHESDVGQHLQFEDEGPFVTLLARLRIARRLVRGALEVPVAQSSAAALQQHELLTVLGHLADELRRRALVGLDNAACHRAQRHGDDDVACILARGAGSGAVLAVLSELVALILEVDERPVLPVAPQHDAAALAAIAAVRTAEGHEFLAAEVCRTGAAVPRAGEYLHVVYKVGTCHNIGFTLQR